MSQANVSRAKAVRALKNNNNDIVNAIMVRVIGASAMLVQLLSAAGLGTILPILAYTVSVNSSNTIGFNQDCFINSQ